MVKREKEFLEEHSPLVVEINGARSQDCQLVGGKAASLAELAQISAVPAAFTITTEAYRVFLHRTPELDELVSTLGNLTDQNEILTQCQIIRDIIQSVDFPPQLIKEITSNLSLLSNRSDLSHGVAVRSSGIAEDTSTASFAGQYDTYLNQRSKGQILNSIRNCFASQFTDRAVSYRNHLGVPHDEAQLAVVIQTMIDSVVSGIAFSIDPRTGCPLTAIDTSYGLGEAVVGGKVTPDSYLVDPKTHQILHRTLGSKTVRTIYAPNGGTIDSPTTNEEQFQFALPEHLITTISREVSKVADHYGKPMDIEFAIDQSGNLWLLQARPETVNSQKESHIISMKRWSIKAEAENSAPIIIHSGKTGSPGVGQGRAIVARSIQEGRCLIQEGDILITERTDPDWEELMRHVSGIVTNIGGPNCHAAIISREHGIPCLVGSGHATEKLQTHLGSPITLDATSSKVYEGLLPLEKVGDDINLHELLTHPPVVPIGLILSTPETAQRMYALRELGNNFLISLLRIEFLLTEIGVHPRALLDYDHGTLQDTTLCHQIKVKIAGFESGKEYYITKLADGLAQFAALFPGSPVTVRTTDFKTNEYSNLLGGNYYESPEANPMMGWRGLIRSLSPENEEVTKMELSAIKRARDVGYQNIQIMFPIVRDPIELTGDPQLQDIGFKGIFEIMSEVGLVRGQDGLKVGIMCEVPANVIRIEDFIKAGLDYISFGTNDLAQFGLAADRDGNENVQGVPHYKETNPAIVQMVQHVIKVCKKHGVKTGICGQAPSNSPEFVRMLLDAGIDSIGVMPDRYLPTYRLLQKINEN